MIYVFFRDGGMFYPLELPDDANIVAHVECNPGTERVETWDGNVVWPLRATPPQEPPDAG